MKSYDTDHSFLASIIEQSNQLNSLTNINNLMSGLSSTLSLQFNKAQLLLGAVRQIDLKSIVLAINKHSRLLFLLSNSDGSSFGMYMKTEFYLPNLQTDMLIIDPPGSC